LPHLRGFGARNAAGASPANGCGGADRIQATPTKQPTTTMMTLVIVFAVLALIAAIFGFGGVASEFAGIAKILLIVFIVLAIVSYFF
jgi:uncharacterized membrane protein YtjA (UPF0391 family)